VSLLLHESPGPGKVIGKEEERYDKDGKNTIRLFRNPCIVPSISFSGVETMIDQYVVPIGTGR